ncbi:hypothetical protein ACU4HD_33730 [Cupriavidus basilensis]
MEVFERAIVNVPQHSIQLFANALPFSSREQFNGQGLHALW